MNKKKKLLFYNWLSGAGGSSETLIETINSYRTANSQKAYVQRAASIWRFWTPINDEYAQFYDTAKEQSIRDDYWALDQAWGIMKYFEIKLPTATSGTFTNSTAATCYTTQVGAYVEFTTTGTWTGLKIASYSDNRGGVFRITINGGEAFDYSVWRASEGNILSEGYLGRSGVGGDVIRVTYQGADPLNPPTGGTARGWIARDSVTVNNAGRFSKCFYIVGSENPNCCHELMQVTQIKYATQYGPSHKEFAWNIRGAITIATQNHWEPNHSPDNLYTASKFADLANDRTAKVDASATNYLTSFTDAFVFAVGGSSITLHQVYEGCNLEDEALSLVEFENTYTWDLNGLSTRNQSGILVDLYNSTMYGAMLEANPSYQTHIATNGTETAANANTGGLFIDKVLYAGLPSWNGNVLSYKRDTGTDFEKSLCAAMTIIDPVASLRADVNLGQGVRLEAQGTRAKMYTVISNNLPVNQGFAIDTIAKYSIGIVPDAFNELKSYVGL